MNGIPMNIEELIASLDKLSNELEFTVRSIADRCKAKTEVTVEDLLLLHDLAPIESSLTCLSQFSAQLKCTIDGYCRWITRHRHILLPDELDDKTIYSLYLYTKSGGVRAQNLEPASEITYAIYALCHPTPPLCNERVKPWLSTPIEFSDGTKLHFHQFKVPSGLEDAVSSDDVANFCLGMDIRGRQLSRTLLRCLMQKRCVNILDYIIRTCKRLPIVCPPDILLLTVLYEMDGCPLLPIIKVIEEMFPGTIKSAEDASHRNALWYTLRHHSQIKHANFCCATDIEDVEQYLLSKGCDPAKPSISGFSWQTMKRVINVVKHYET